MDFELSEDQVALQEAARSLLDGLASPERVRAAGNAGADGHTGIDQALWAAMIEQGWTALTIEEAHGGLGFGFVEAAVLLHEIGRHNAPAPFLEHLMATEALAAAGEHDWVARLIGGEAVGTIAWAGRPGAVDTTGGRLTGRADPVIYGPSAQIIVAVVPGAGVFAVEPAAGSIVPAAPMDVTRQLGWLVFDDAMARSTRQIGDAAAAETRLDRAAVAYCAELLGGAEVAMRMAVDYAKERVQFDRPIGSFQAVKHRCADMLVDVEGIRSSTYYAAWAVGAGDADASIAASSAKVWAADAARRVMQSSLQVHGGIGFTWEHDLHFFFKRSQLDQFAFGDATYHRARLTQLLRPKVEAGQSVI